MKRDIYLENLAQFRKRLADAKTTEAEREVLLKLLAEEEARGFLPGDIDVSRRPPRRARGLPVSPHPLARTAPPVQRAE